ncbi:MAG TPA: DNRLRE domain-containing protein, partial [Thermoplasmata archaeon]|nr:DNRLRE domain-containing protein [Thermoplasmata archaeon]
SPMPHAPFVGAVLLLVLSPGLVAANLGGAGPGTRELGPTTRMTWQPTPAELADTYLRNGGGANSNYGTSPDLFVGYWGVPEWTRSVVRFPALPLPAGAVISAAQLELYLHAADTPDAMDLSVHGMTNNWTESGATWNDVDGANAWNASGGGGDFDPIPVDIETGVTNGTGWYTWNLTSLVLSWWNATAADHGLLVRQADDDFGVSLGRKEFFSSDSANVSVRPRLLLEYRAPLAAIDLLTALPWLLLAVAIIPMAWVVLRRAKAGPFRPTDLYLIHRDGRLIAHIGSAEGPVHDELASSGMLTVVAQFVRDSFGGSGAHGELKSLTVDERAVAIAKGASVFLALVFEGRAPLDLDRRIGEFLETIEGAWGDALRHWDGLRAGLADLDEPLAWFLRTGYRSAHPRPPLRVAVGKSPR